MNDPEQREILVIGGGPAGSVAATMLARRGYDVVLLERERFPREHIGESLLPASMPVLEDLGVLPQIEAAGFPKKWGATMIWGRDPDAWSWRFSETNRAYPYAYQVSRAEFDKILLDNARAAGVDVREGAAVTEIDLSPSTDDRHSIRYRVQETVKRVASRWIVDASGQAAVLSRSLGLRRWDDRFRNMAIYAYFQDARRLPTPDENNIFIESYPEGWAWNIPLRRGQSSVGFVIDSGRGADGIAERGVGEYFRRQLRAAPKTSAMLDGARMTVAPQVVKDWSYTSERTVGDGWILVGDAACFIDPLFSSGVHLAIMAAVMAAAYIHASEREPSMREPAARVYERLYRTEYTHFRELASLFYASNRTVESYFWEARRILGTPEDTDDESGRQSFVRAVAGQAPRGYERAVLERGDLPASFTESVRAVESERNARAAAFDPAAAMDAVPKLAAGARVERRPIFADDQFQWSYVLLTDDRPGGLPVSPLVSALLAGMDGRRSARGNVERLSAGAAPEQRRMVEGAALAALRLLVVDGAVEV